jgi:hypothetical protein
MIAAAAAALGSLALNSQAFAAPNDDRPMPLDVENVEIAKVGLMPTGFPERATGIDAPMDMSTGNTTAMSMVNSGQVSPAAGAAGSLIGALVVAAIDAGVDANRNGKIERMLESQSFDARAVFDTALLDALRQGDVTAIYQANVERPEKDEFFKVSGKSETTLDAAVDVVVYQYGYTLDNPGWRPSVSAQVQVHDMRTGEMLMNEFVTYGRMSTVAPAAAYPGSYTVAPGQPAIIVPFDLSNAFDSVDAYAQDDPERAVATLTAALQATANTIAGLITVAAPQAEAETAPAAEPVIVAAEADVAAEPASPEDALPADDTAAAVTTGQ